MHVNWIQTVNYLKRRKTRKDGEDVPESIENRKKRKKKTFPKLNFDFYKIHCSFIGEEFILDVIVRT